MPLYSLSHKYVGRLKHKYRLSIYHLQYVIRKNACNLVMTSNIPRPEIGTKGGKAKKWLEQREDATRKNGRVIDKIMLALPIELTLPQRTDLIKAFMTEISGGEEYFWLAALHDQDSDNPHVHIIVRDEGLHTGKRVVEFSEKNSTLRIRKIWEDVYNAHLAKANIDVRVDCRSLKVQRAELVQKANAADDFEERKLFLEAAEKLNRKPAGHEGPGARGVEDKWEVSTKLARLREVRLQADLRKILAETTGCPPCPDIVLIQNLIARFEAKKPVIDLCARDIQNNRYWDEQYQEREEYAGMIAVAAAAHPRARYRDILKFADRQMASLNEDPTHPMTDIRADLAQLGRKTLNGGWRQIKELKILLESTLDLRVDQSIADGLISDPEDAKGDQSPPYAPTAPQEPSWAVWGLHRDDEALEDAVQAQEQAEAMLRDSQRDLKRAEETRDGIRDFLTGKIISGEAIDNSYLPTKTTLTPEHQEELAREEFLARYCDADGDEAVGPLKPALSDYDDLSDPDTTFARHLAEWQAYEKDRLERAEKNKRSVWEREFPRKRQQLAEYRKLGVPQILGAALEAVRGIFEWLRDRVRAARQTLGIDHALTQQMTADWVDVLDKNKPVLEFVTHRHRQTALAVTQEATAIKSSAAKLWDDARARHGEPEEARQNVPRKPDVKYDPKP